MTQPITHHPSSYRDPSGFIFEKDGTIYRQVNKSFKEHFDHFIESGCYKHLIEKGLLIPYEQVNQNLTGDSNCYRTLKPEKISFISYPFEWSFDMLKDAALLTLQIAREALGYEMILKDATPYNIQWYKGRFIFIDTLSFEKYNETPWVCYRQFCESFLGPLLLMHYSKQSLQQLQLAWPEGIPLAVIKSILPWRSRFFLHTYLHIHLHADIAGKSKSKNETAKTFSKQKLLNLISSLEILIRKLKLPDQKSTWSGYYEEASQRSDYLEVKKNIINQWLNEIPAVKTAADMGANDGVFSSLLAEKAIPVIAADFDPYCINNLYTSIKISKERNIQPVLIDLSNPSPAIGINNEERNSFISRLDADLILALAVIHHLAIGKNIPLKKVAELFHKAGKYLIIEFVPKEDDKIKLMLRSKQDIYFNYTEDEFIHAFEEYFFIVKKQQITGSLRTLYLMKKRNQ